MKRAAGLTVARLRRRGEEGPPEMARGPWADACKWVDAATGATPGLPDTGHLAFRLSPVAVSMKLRGAGEDPVGAVATRSSCEPGIPAIIRRAARQLTKAWCLRRSVTIRFVMALCDHVYVLAEGRNLFDGRPEGVQRHPAVVDPLTGVPCAYTTIWQGRNRQVS